jgi:hypothetical protein
MCIPENKANLTVVTQDIERVELAGQRSAAVGFPLDFERSVFSTNGQAFSPETIAIMNFSHSPDALIPHHGTNYSWTPTTIGAQPIRVCVDGHCAECVVDVFPQPEFDSEYLVFKDRDVPYKINGGPGDLTAYEYVFTDQNVASVDPAAGLFHGTQRGSTGVVAALRNARPTRTKVTVIEIYGILFEQSTETPYVGSYILFRAWLDTSHERRNILAHNVSWAVEGAANWTIDAENLVIYGEKPGNVTISATCLGFERSLTFNIDYELVVKPAHILLAIGATANVTVERDLPVNLSTTVNGLAFGENSITAISPGKYAVSVGYHSQLKSIAVVASDPETIYVENETKRQHVLDPDGQEYDDVDAALRAKRPKPGKSEIEWNHEFRTGQPDDRDTRALFGYTDADGASPWGVLVGCSVTVNPGGSVSVDAEVNPENISIELVSQELNVTFGPGKKGAEITVSAGNEFKAPGRVVLIHTVSGKKLDLRVLAAEGKGAKLLLAIVTLVGSGGYLVSRLV